MCISAGLRESIAACRGFIGQQYYFFEAYKTILM